MSPHRASLLDLISTDLASYRREDTGGGRARFVAAEGAPSFEVSQREERRFLGRTTIARFHTTHPGATGRGGLELRHTGRRRRTGIEATVITGDDAIRDVAGRIEKDEGFVAAILPLDFTRFALQSDGIEWKTNVELMGASLVAIAFPPIRSYVRLYPDQLQALTATFAELDRVMTPDSAL